MTDFQVDHWLEGLSVRFMLRCALAQLTDVHISVFDVHSPWIGKK